MMSGGGLNVLVRPCNSLIDYVGNKYLHVLSLNMLTVCVRNDLGRESAQSDSLLTHTFSTVVFYNEVMLIWSRFPY